jgi:hypothetical protein
MRKIFVAVSCITFCFSLIVGVGKAYPQESTPKEEVRSDQQAVKAAHEAIKQNAQEAKTEEKQLQQQIKDAVASGDMATANQLKAQLKNMHRENAQEKKQDMKNLKVQKKELRYDANAVRRAAPPPPKPPRLDRDNNPPGPKGGAGTNWENPAGPVGGPGASPNRRK